MSDSRTARVLPAIGVALVAAAVVAVVVAVMGPQPASPTYQSYPVSTDLIPNPDRGFYRYTETHARADGSGATPLDAAALARWRTEGVTLVFRYYYLERYRDQDTVDDVYLAALDRDLTTARAAGIKLIVRFAYVQGSGTPTPPYGDAPDAPRVIGQIRQLAPVLNRNADVIAVLQAGFVGVWGEWYYTDTFAHDPAHPDDLDDADRTKRRDVLLALLDATDPGIVVQVRYPQIKQTLLAADDPRAGRVGIHDDCFLAGTDDYGTFRSATDQDWLAEQSRGVPVGGETCAVNPPRSLFPSAAGELARYRWSFLNADFEPSVLSSWGSASLEEVGRRLGYRLSLGNTGVSPTAHPGGPVAVDLTVDNGGYAAPFRARPVELVMTGPGGTFRAPLPFDVRTWQPGTNHAEATVCAPPTPGTYTLHLALPDPSPQAAVSPAYAIQLANSGVWDAPTGWNDLKRTLVVDGSAQGCTAALVS